MGNRVSQAEFARRQQCSEAYVSKLKDEGRLVMVDGLVDLEASRERLEMTRDSRGGDRSAGAERESAEPLEGSYLHAKRREMVATAGLKELELRRRSGELVEREEVERESYARSRAAQRDLLLLPDRCAAMVPPEHQLAIRQQLREEIEKICNDLARDFPVPDARLVEWMEEELKRIIARNTPAKEAANG